MNPLDPSTTALLIMDIQAGILGRLEGADALVERIAGLEQAARRAGVQVGYVRVAFTDEDFLAVPPYSSFAAIAADADLKAGMHESAPSTQIDARVAPQPDDIVVRKTRIGPFTTTDLQAQLVARGVRTLVLTGISTSGVVLSTVRQAADLDFRVVVVGDGVADMNDEVHRVLVGTVFPRQAEVVTSVDLLEALA